MTPDDFDATGWKSINSQDILLGNRWLFICGLFLFNKQTKTKRSSVNRKKSHKISDEKLKLLHFFQTTDKHFLLVTPEYNQ